jgi:mediator of RNA polymerase II transcription subunit 16
VVRLAASPSLLDLVRDVHIYHFNLDTNSFAEVLNSLNGLIRYCIDLIAYIIDALFALSKRLSLAPDTPLSLSTLQTTIEEMQCPALALLLASTSRTFLRYNCRALRGLLNKATRDLPTTADVMRRQAYTTVISVLERTPAVKLATFDRLLAEIDTGARLGYEDMGDKERNSKERELLVRVKIPEVLFETADTLLGPTLRALRQEIDPSALYFKDVGWLGLTDDQRAKNWWDKHRVDAIRKVIVPRMAAEKQGWRRCIRCCVWMGELGEGRENSIERVCLCGSMLMAV